MKKLSLLSFCCLCITMLFAQTPEEDVAIGIQLRDQGKADSAFQHFLSAAERGSPEGMYATGMMYSLGEGVARDSTIANDWWIKSAHLGFKKSYKHLGARFLRAKQTDSAIFYLEQIADYDAEVKGMLGKIYYDADEEVTAFRLFLDGAKDGDLASMYYLGEAYYDGYGTEYNEKEAVRWWQRAAKAGYQPAQTALEDYGYDELEDVDEVEKPKEKKSRKKKSAKKKSKDQEDDEISEDLDEDSEE